MFAVVLSTCLVLLIFVITATSHCVVKFPENSSGVGVSNVTFNSVRYCEYLGVRFATAARFEDPKLYQPKNQEQYKQQGNVCPQVNDFGSFNLMLGSEDCLFLNIYVPEYGSKKVERGGLPVLVFIHGGSFQIGSARFEFDGADLLIEKQIIVVSINYRLDVLGFLHYPPYNITGNYGLKDQQAALKWINRYIKFFGGDPNKVTLMGQSAGAASVIYHLYSDRSRGLFQQAALLSGTFLASWAYMYRPEYFAEQFFNHFRIRSRDQLFDREVQDLLMINNSYKWMGYYYFNRYNTWPIPTREADDDPNPFFTASPQELMLRKRATDVPLLVGLTLREFELVSIPLNKNSDRVNIPNRWSNKLWKQVNNFIQISSQKLIRKGLISNETEFIVKMSNNMNLNFPVEHFVNQIISKGHSAPIFAYRFDFDGKFGRYKYDIYKDEIAKSRYGAVHGDDLGYIFNPYIAREALNRRRHFRKEWEVHGRMSEMVANFVKHGNPSLEDFQWTAYNAEPNQKHYAVIDTAVEMKAGSMVEPYFYNFCKTVYDCLYYFNCTTIEDSN